MTQFISTLLLLFVSGCGSIVDWSLLATDEVCDGEDNDLDGAVDEGLPQYADLDGDGFGDLANMVGCGDGAVAVGGDCDDGDAAVHPGSIEVCGDGVVNDCELSLDEARAACPTEDLSLSTADGILTGEAAGDAVGYDVSSAGDVNRDGIADLFVSSFLNDRNGISSGAAFIVFGPIGTERNLSTADVVLIGQTTDDWFGISIAGSADVGVGVEQDIAPGLLVGASRSDSGGNDKGAAYVFYGPISDEIDAKDADVVFVGESPSDNAGAAVAWVGDSNGDNRADLLIGAASSDRSGLGAGTAYLFTSEVHGFVSLGAADCIISGDSINDGAARGISGVGDTNGDGLMDIFIGAYGADIGGSDAGSASLFLGPIFGELHLADADVTLVGEAVGDQSGVVVRGAGDANLDGYADVLVAAMYSDRGGENSGAVYLLMGPLLDQSFATADATIVGEGIDDLLTGLVKTPQDLNGDGSTDLVMASYRNDRAGGESGATYVFLSPIGGVHSAADADVVLTGEAAEDYSGNSLAALPDQDGDGLGELLIGAYRNDRAGTDAGAAYLILGKSLWNY